jgi:peptidoglycan/xylan/chitin deacetylase (PgdA/CDA1 family)
VNVRTSVKRLSAFADRLAPPPPGVTVLIHHRVGGGSGSEVDLDAAAFERQLEHLVAHHRVLTLDEALVELSARHPVADAGSGRPVVLTFDDGTADFVDVAVPLLMRHGVPATLYAATDFIDRQVTFPWGAPPTSWAALRDAVSTGLVTVGSHTHSHWLLDRMDPAVIAADLDRSVELISEHLGTPPRHFAYPKALPGSTAAEVAVRRRFASAALAGSRVNRAGRTDPHRLWRTPVQRSDEFRWFAAKAAGGLRLEGWLRAASSRAKYRGQQR